MILLAKKVLKHLMPRRKIIEFNIPIIYGGETFLISKRALDNFSNNVVTYEDEFQIGYKTKLPLSYY